jgi:hypothetical protein
VTDIAPLPDVLNKSVAQPRFRTLLLGLFAAMGLMLAAVGIFGVISYSVSRRTHELGIRMALGAQPGSVLGMILRETLTLTLIGVAVGVSCALAAARLITHLLFKVTPYDPVTLALVSLVLVAVGALAGYIPARRAMRVDPVVALRHEQPACSPGRVLRPPTPEARAVSLPRWWSKPVPRGGYSRSRLGPFTAHSVIPFDHTPPFPALAMDRPLASLFLIAARSLLRGNDTRALAS